MRFIASVVNCNRKPLIPHLGMMIEVYHFYTMCRRYAYFIAAKITDFINESVLTKILIRQALLILSASMALSGCSNGDKSNLSDGLSYQKPVSPYEKMLTDLEEQSKAYTFLDRTDTLGGIDADNNGIRDDIEKFLSYKNYSERERSGLNQMAKSIQEVVQLNLNDELAVHDATINIYKATACLMQMQSDKHNDYDKRLLYTAQQLGNMTANTRKRLVNYLAFNDKVDIAYNAKDIPMPCDFDHANLNKLKENSVQASVPSHE